jgi:hypothetical protein
MDETTPTTEEKNVFGITVAQDTKSLGGATSKIMTNLNSAAQNQTNPYGTSLSLRFPTTLGNETNNTPIIMFIAKKWDSSRTTRQNRQGQNYKKLQQGSVSLYLPSFNESTNVVWDETQTFATAAMNYMYEQLGSILPGTKMVKDALKISNGVSISQDSVATFQDIENRNFTFSFELMPMSRDDTVQIQQIIRFFRLNSAPIFSETIISAPCIFDVKIIGVKGGYFDFLPMALTNMNVSYGDGQSQAMQLMADDTPSLVKVDISFREIRKPYRDSFE